MRSVFLILTVPRSFVEFAVNGGLPVIPLTLWTDIFLVCHTDIKRVKTTENVVAQPTFFKTFQVLASIL